MFQRMSAGSCSTPERMPKEVVIRNWRAGDRFWPAHTAAEKKVKELLSDRHATGAREKTLAGCGRAKAPAWSGCGGLRFRQPFGRRQALRRAIWIREIAGMM